MPRRISRLFALNLALGWAVAAGCSSEPTVSGEVTLDGQPLKEGVISFEPVDGKSQPASTNIVDGRFSLTMTPGEKRVKISSPRPTGKKIKMIDAPDSKEVEEMGDLPERYNIRSELTMTVQGGKQEKKFELKSK
jgi:hypothetical protein